MSREYSDCNVSLDAELASVPLPVGMLQRLRQIPLASDEQLDAAVRDLPVPSELDSRLRRIGRAGARWARLRQTAITSCLTLLIGGSYVGATLAFLLTARGTPEPPPVRLVSRVTVGIAEQSNRRELELDGVELAMAQRETPSHGTPPSLPGPPIFHLAAHRGPSSHAPLGETRTSFVGLNDRQGPDWRQTGARAVAPSFPVRDRPAQSPELREVPRVVRRGTAPPPLDEIAQTFLLRTSFNPWVSLGRHSSFRTSVAPLRQDTFSYDLTRQLLREGKVPSPRMLRTEDFLAAIDYRFPPPKDRPVELHVSGGPSPLSTEKKGSGLFLKPVLLQIGVQARDIATSNRPGSRLTLAVDVSDGMAERGGLEMVRRALAELTERMAPKDRVSLVVFNDDAYVLAEHLGRRGLGQYVASLAAEGSQNVIAGLRQAYAVAYRRTEDLHSAARVVLLTDLGAQVDPIVARRIATQLAATTSSGITLHVINVGYSRRRESPDPGLMDLAWAGGGNVHRATNSDEIGWVLRGIVTGESQLAACDVRLQVTFNPKSVSAYRLLGHEVADLPAEPETDFRAGQSATALYEVLLARSTDREVDPIEEVAAVGLSWWDPASGQPDSVAARFRRDQFAPTMIDAPVPLQAASVVAEAVEVLRRSPFIASRSNPRSLATVLRRAGQVDGVLHLEPTFSEFVSFIQQAQTATPH